MTSETEAPEWACASDWSERPLLQVVAHVLEWYWAPVERILETLPHAMSEPPTDHAANKVLQERIGEIFTALQDAVETHMLLEGNALFPVIIAAERPELTLVRRSGKDLTDLLERVNNEHKLIGRLVYDLEEAVRPMVSLSLLHRPAALRWTLQMIRLAQLLKRQVQFEDRYVLPRALQLFRRLP